MSILLISKFSLSLSFKNLIIICTSVDFLEFLECAVPLGYNIYVSHQIWKVSTTISLSSLYDLIYLFLELPNAYIGLRDDVL